MPAPEAADNWLTVAGIIGSLAAAAMAGFYKVYGSAREEERMAAARSPDVAREAIGAAFVDRSTAHDLAGIREDVRIIREIAEDRKKHDDRESLLEELEARLSKSPPART